MRLTDILSDLQPTGYLGLGQISEECSHNGPVRAARRLFAQRTQLHWRPAESFVETGA